MTVYFGGHYDYQPDPPMTDKQRRAHKRSIVLGRKVCKKQGHLLKKVEITKNMYWCQRCEEPRWMV